MPKRPRSEAADNELEHLRAELLAQQQRLAAQQQRLAEMGLQLAAAQRVSSEFTLRPLGLAAGAPSSVEGIERDISHLVACFLPQEGWVVVRGGSAGGVWGAGDGRHHAYVLGVFRTPFIARLMARLEFAKQTHVYSDITWGDCVELDLSLWTLSPKAFDALGQGAKSIVMDEASAEHTETESEGDEEDMDELNSAKKADILEAFLRGEDVERWMDFARPFNPEYVQEHWHADGSGELVLHEDGDGHRHYRYRWSVTLCRINEPPPREEHQGTCRRCMEIKAQPREEEGGSEEGQGEEG